VNAGGPVLHVEVVFAEPLRTVARTFRIAGPATVADVLRLAAASPELGGLVADHVAVGIFGRRVEGAEPIEDGDRLEIYRPLLADPKTARRARARTLNKSGRS